MGGVVRSSMTQCGRQRVMVVEEALLQLLLRR